MTPRRNHSLSIVALIAALLAPLLLTTGPAGAAIAPCAVLDVYNHPNSGTDIKAKRIINGSEVTQARLSPGDRQFVTVGAANEEWVIRKVNGAEKVWEGPAQCADELIVVGGDNDNAGPVIAFNDIPIQPTPIVISGTATDDSNIVEVKAAIRELGTTTYYRPDGSTASWHKLDLNGIGGGPLVDWSTPAMNLPDNTYEIIVRATDQHGNRSEWEAEAFVVRGGVDANTPPRITVLSHSPNEVLTAGSIAFDGTAVDINNLSDVKATIMNVATGEFLRLDGTFGAWQRMQVVWDADEARWNTVPVVVPPGNYLFSVNLLAVETVSSRWSTPPRSTSTFEPASRISRSLPAHHRQLLSVLVIDSKRGTHSEPSGSGRTPLPVPCLVHRWRGADGGNDRLWRLANGRMGADRGNRPSTALKLAETA